MENFLTAAKLHVHAKRFMDAYSAAMQPLSREFAIPQTAAEILLFLANNPENRTAKDICVTLGFLERKSVPGDRRKLRLEPTEKASSIIARGRQMQERFAQTLAQGLSPEELSCFARCMETISQNLERAATGME